MGDFGDFWDFPDFGDFGHFEGFWPFWGCSQILAPSLILWRGQFTKHDEDSDSERERSSLSSALRPPDEDELLSPSKGKALTY